jgi:hypothetical protein
MSRLCVALTDLRIVSRSIGLTVKASITRIAFPLVLSVSDALTASCNVTPAATTVQASFDDSTIIFNK